MGSPTLRTASVRRTPAPSVTAKGRAVRAEIFTLLLCLAAVPATAQLTATPEVRNYHVVTQSTASDSTSPKSLTVSCPAGTTALTGGVSTSAGPDIGLSESYPGPGDPPTSWVGSARELVDTGTSWDLRVDVVCGEVSGYERISLAGAQSTDAAQWLELECPTGKVPFSGGMDLTGADLRQILTASFDISTPIEPIPRRQVNAYDFGAGVSSSPWGLDVHAVCSDASRRDVVFDEIPFQPGTPKSIVVNCLGGKVPVGGSANGGDAGLAWSRPKDGAPGGLPVGWDAQSRGSSSWTMQAHVECAPLADPTIPADGLRVLHRAEYDAYDGWGWAHGSLLNGVPFAPGVDGVAWSFDGTTDYAVSIPSVTNGSHFQTLDLYPEADFTASAWFRTSMTPSGDHGIVTLYDLGGVSQGFNSSMWALNMDLNGQLEGYVRSAGGVPYDVLTGPVVNDGEWHHAAIVRDLIDFEVELWLDGVRVDVHPLTGSIASQVLEPGDPAFPDSIHVGAWQEYETNNLVNLFDGEIDEFAYWDRALSAHEIRDVAGCHRALGPRVLNLAAERFTSPVGAGHELCVFFEAGVHTLTLVDPVADPEAQFTGWSPGPSAPWGTIFSVDPEIDGGFSFGLPVGAASGQAAYDATLDKDVTLTLSQDQRVYFSLVDDTALDNLGGVSIRVPEPGFGSGLAVCGLLLAFAGWRRRIATGVR